jgi:hypothetical protein
MMMWEAMLFFWLCAYWLGRYIGRTFRMDSRRRRDWRLLIIIATLMGLASLFMPWITVNSVVLPYDYQSGRWRDITRTLTEQDINILTYVTYYNTDVPMFIGASGTFPLGWVNNNEPRHQRPTFFMLTSQLCRVTTLPMEGYASGNLICNNIAANIVSYWLANVLFAWFAAITVYELVRAHIENNRRVAFLAGILTVVSGFTLFFFPILVSDYAEIFIALASVWMVHRAFSDKPCSWDKVIAIGIAFGLLLLMKLNLIFVLWGCALAVGTWRPRLLLAFGVIPAVIFAAYAPFVQAIGIPFVVLEATSAWPTVNFITTTWLREYSLFQKWRTVTLWAGLTFDKVFFMFGALLPIAVLDMILDKRYPRPVFAAAWILYLCMCAFALGFQYSYVQHTLGLLPFVLGGVALGADWAEKQALNQYGSRRTSFRARFVCGMIFWGPVYISLIMVLAWGAKDWINYI